MKSPYERSLLPSAVARLMHERAFAYPTLLCGSSNPSSPNFQVPNTSALQRVKVIARNPV